MEPTAQHSHAHRCLAACLAAAASLLPLTAPRGAHAQTPNGADAPAASAPPATSTPPATTAPPEANTPPAGPASDESPEQHARTLFRRGDAAYREGRYQTAIDLFREAYRLSGRPLLLFNLANAQERLGNLRDAIESLESFLPHAGAEALTVEMRLRGLRERLAAQQSAAPPQPPQPPSSVTVHAPGRPASTRGLALTIAGGASLITSLVFDGLAFAAAEAARPGCTTVDGRQVCSTPVQPHVEDAGRHALVADVTLGVGLALATAGVVLLVVDGNARPRASATAPSAAAATARAGQAGLELGWRF